MAAFAVFLVLLVLFFAFRHRSWKKGIRSDGDVFLFFIALFGAAEILLDSTRYDSSFLRSNGFVSITQRWGAVGLLVGSRAFLHPSVRLGRLRVWHAGLWLIFLAPWVRRVYGVLRQRHGGPVSVLLFCLLPALLRPSQRLRTVCRAAPRRLRGAGVKPASRRADDKKGNRRLRIVETRSAVP
jgi:hypothetical protein